MKKIALILLSALMLASLAPVITTPAFATESNIEKLKELEFNVGEYLKLDNDQEQKYFDEGKNPIVDFILRVINFALTIIGSIAIIILIISGFMMMLSQGNQQKLDEAKDVFMYAIIGLVVTFLAYIIVIFVQSIFTQ